MTLAVGDRSGRCGLGVAAGALGGAADVGDQRLDVGFEVGDEPAVGGGESGRQRGAGSAGVLVELLAQAPLSRLKRAGVRT